MFHLSFDISAQPTRSASTVSNMPSEVRSPLTIWELQGMGSDDARARYIRGSKLQMDSQLLLAARSIASASACVGDFPKTDAAPYRERTRRLPNG